MSRFVANLLRLPAALKAAVMRWWEHKHADSAAALAFYSIFSLIPLILIILQVAALIVDAQVAEDQLRDSLTGIAGPQITEAITKLIKNNAGSAKFSTSSLVSILIIFFTASRVVDKLRATLEGIFGKPDTSKLGKRAIVLRTLRGRLLSVGLVATIGIVLAFSVFLTTAADFILAQFPEIIGNWLWIGQLVTVSATALSLIILISLTLRWLPRKAPRFLPCFAGAVLTTILLLLLQRGLSLYIAYASSSSPFAGAFTLILILFWIYFAMQIFLLGAEFSRSLNDSRLTKPEESP